MLAERRLSIGIDLGGTSLRVGLFDSDFSRGISPLDSHSLRTRVEHGPEAVVSDMAGSIRRMLDAYHREHHYEVLVEGIGIGSPGPLNLEQGTLGHLPNFPGWDGFPLRGHLAEVTGSPVILECDANAAAVAEWKFGAGRLAQVDSLAMITLGTGVGSGLILNGRVWHGMVGMGGEVGHLCLNPLGPACGCGSRGCLEQYASANGLLRLAREQADGLNGSEALKELSNQTTGFTPLAVATLAEQGDASALCCFKELGSWLGLGLAGLINTLDLPLIIIGGGVASAWKLFAPTMFAGLREFSFVYRLGEPTQRQTLEKNRTFIRPAELGPAAGLLGAALLPVLSKTQLMVEAAT
jgi:glucokinase